ncbi:MAG: hypothetical protein KBD63_05390 [Bacteriovoracaceae bacterium]|nr:hypothetical protein [Bacteriovoracaceae bacterium]
MKYLFFLFLMITSSAFSSSPTVEEHELLLMMPKRNVCDPEGAAFKKLAEFYALYKRDDFLDQFKSKLDSNSCRLTPEKITAIFDNKTSRPAIAHIHGSETEPALVHVPRKDILADIMATGIPTIISDQQADTQIGTTSSVECTQTVAHTIPFSLLEKFVHPRILDRDGHVDPEKMLASVFKDGKVGNSFLLNLPLALPCSELAQAVFQNGSLSVGIDEKKLVCSGENCILNTNVFDPAKKDFSVKEVSIPANLDPLGKYLYCQDQAHYVDFRTLPIDNTKSKYQYPNLNLNFHISSSQDIKFATDIASFQKVGVSSGFKEEMVNCQMVTDLGVHITTHEDHIASQVSSCLGDAVALLNLYDSIADDFKYLVEPAMNAAVLEQQKKDLASILRSVEDGSLTEVQRKRLNEILAGSWGRELSDNIERTFEISSQNTITNQEKEELKKLPNELQALLLNPETKESIFPKDMPQVINTLAVNGFFNEAQALGKKYIDASNYSDMKIIFNGKKMTMEPDVLDVEEKTKKSKILLADSLKEEKELHATKKGDPSAFKAAQQKFGSAQSKFHLKEKDLKFCKGSRGNCSPTRIAQIEKELIKSQEEMQLAQKKVEVLGTILQEQGVKLENLQVSSGSSQNFGNTGDSQGFTYNPPSQNIFERMGLNNIFNQNSYSSQFNAGFNSSPSYGYSNGFSFNSSPFATSNPFSQFGY